MSINNPVTTLGIEIRMGEMQYAQICILRENSTRIHSATPASHLRVARVMRHRLREIDPLMGMPPCSYGGPRKPAASVEPENNAELRQAVAQ